MAEAPHTSASDFKVFTSINHVRFAHNWVDKIRENGGWYLDNSEFLLVCGNVRQNLLCSANIKTEQAISYFRISGCFRVSNQLRD